MTTKISKIWEVEKKKELKPIKLLTYLNPMGGLSPTTNRAADYDNIVKLRGEQDCIVMYWNEDNEDNEDNDSNRDIFLAEWNDGVVWSNDNAK